MFEWKVMKNVEHYQVWRQTRELRQGEPMNSGVRETQGWFDTREEAQAFADKLNGVDMKIKKRLFVDMDGTLAVFKQLSTLEQLYEKDYFRNLEPMQNVVDAVRRIVKENPEIEVNILSAVLKDSKYALAEKNEWLDKYLPEVDKEHRIFTPCGEDKKQYIKENITKDDFLLDDYTKNLLQWHPPGTGIKLLNGINHTHGTWQKDCINSNYSADKLYNDIISVMANEKIASQSMITARMCDFVDLSKSISGEVAVLKEDILNPQYQTLENQIFYVRKELAYGKTYDMASVYAENVYTGEMEHWKREDFYGVLKAEHYPDWVKEKLPVLQETKVEIDYDMDMEL